MSPGLPICDRSVQAISPDHRCQVRDHHRCHQGHRDDGDGDGDCCYWPGDGQRPPPELPEQVRLRRG